LLENYGSLRPAHSIFGPRLRAQIAMQDWPETYKLWANGDCRRD